MNIGEQFNIPERSEEQSKREYESYLIEFMMKRVADLLPLEYRGVYK